MKQQAQAPYRVTTSRFLLLLAIIGAAVTAAMWRSTKPTIAPVNDATPELSEIPVAEMLEVTAENPRPRRRSVVTKSRVALLLVIIVAVTTGAAWPSPKPTVAPADGDALVNSAGSRGPVHLDQMATTLVWRSTGRATVAMELTNTSDTPQVIQTWWLLARIGTKQVWLKPIVHSATVQATVPAHTTRTVSVTSGPENVPIGTYGLSGWVHYRASGSFQHSDGRALSSYIDIAPVDTSMENRSTAIGNFVAAANIPKTWVEGRQESIQIRLVNPTTEPRPIRVWVTVDPGKAAVKPTQRDASTTVVVAQAHAQVVDIAVTPMSGPGLQTLHVWIADAVPYPLQPVAQLVNTADITVH